MKWLKLRKLKREEIQKAIKIEVWQNFRESLKGKTMKEKLDLLKWWYGRAVDKKIAEVQIINYINALKRGGLIK
jgi:hypothetical protein